MKAECKIGLEVEMEGGMWEMSPDNDEIKLVIWRTCLGLGLHVRTYSVYFSILMSFLSCPIMLLCYNR